MNNSNNRYVNPYETSPFGRVITAMVTPFRVDGQLSLTETANLAKYLVRNGSEGLVVAGTTGESATLSVEENIDVVRAVRNAVDVPILAGTGSNNTTEAIEMTREIAESDLADGLLVVSPYYNRPPQTGIVDYYEHIADVSGDLPIILYDIPVRTGRAVETNTISYLARNVSNIVGVKLAAGDLDQTVALNRLHPELLLYSGDDSLNLEHARRGAVGAISVISHWAGSLMVEMYNALANGDDETAERITEMLRSSCNFSSTNETPNPIPTKAMMRTLGINVGYGRSPMVVTQRQEENLEASARDILNNLRDHELASF